MFLRNFTHTLTRNKVSSLLNIVGLALAFATAYILSVQAWYDLSYNSYFKDGEHCYQFQMGKQFYNDGNPYSPVISHHLGIKIGNESSFVESYGTLTLYNSPVFLQNGDTPAMEFKEQWGLPGTAETLGLRLIEGNMKELVTPEEILLDESTAKRLQVKVGETVNSGGERYRKVVGIFEDIPRNCTLYGMNMYSTFVPSNEILQNTSEYNNRYFYRLRKGVTPDDFIRAIYNNHIKGTYHKVDSDNPHDYVKLVPIRDLYFDANDKTLTYSMACAALLIWCVAFFNFLNFFMASLPSRMRSVATRHLYGCPKKRIRRDFILETFFLVLLALGAAWTMLSWTTTKLNEEQIINIPLAIRDNLNIFGGIVAAAIGSGIIISLYPAHYLTSLRPDEVLKRTFTSSSKGRNLRHLLLGLQFAVSLVLLTFTLFSKQQYHYLTHADLGFNKNDLYSLQIPTDRPADKLIEDLKSSPYIKDAALAQCPISMMQMTWGRVYPRTGHKVTYYPYPVSENFPQFLGIQMTGGRGFENSDKNRTGTAIFNETARKNFELVLNDPVGGHQGDALIAGFCKDIHFHSLKEESRPFCFYFFGQDPWFNLSTLYLRATPNAPRAAIIQQLKKSLNKLYPEWAASGENQPEPHGFRSFEEEIEKQYQEEKNYDTLFTIFCIVMMSLPLMGVLGLVFFETQYRRREIAIRRVHGAKGCQIYKMFIIQYLRILATSALISVPISYLCVRSWLDGFANHTSITPWPFLVAFAAIALITTLIVVAESYRTVNENPTKVLNLE